MGTMVDQDFSGPPRGRGHYSDDMQQWWDDQYQRWFPVQEETDVLEIEIEAGVSGMDRAVLTMLGTPPSAYRFVGIARSEDGRRPEYRIPGDSFSMLQVPPMDLPPEQEWSPEIADRLMDLRTRLADEGWIPIGRREQSWSYRYRRPCISLPGEG